MTMFANEELYPPKIEANNSPDTCVIIIINKEHKFVMFIPDDGNIAWSQFSSLLY